MAAKMNTRTTLSALAALILAAAIGLMPVAAAVLISAPSAEIGQ